MAPMPGSLLLNAATDGVEYWVGERYEVKSLHHLDLLGQSDAKDRRIIVGDVKCPDANTNPEARRPLGRPRGPLGKVAGLDHVYEL